ncbi:MAG TPA: Flp family type IVb pilin [Acetobacteraceae bacterium]|nr:Flp family type IVb pilin [Acetobacteraceae bacterium]
MSNIIARVRALNTDKRGIAALEYALLASFVALAIIAGAATFGTSVKTYFTTLGTHVASMNATPGH